MVSYDTPIYVIKGFFLWMIFFPLMVFPISLLCGIWKLCVVLAAKCFQPQLIPISFNDAFFATHACEEQPLMSVGVTFRLQGRVETESLMNRFKECFLTEENSERYRNLYCYFQLYGGFVFKKRVEKLVLENHFFEKTLPRGMEPEDYLGSWIVTDTYRHKPERQPCWQVVILRRGQEHDHEETIMSIKMHHGMMDGYSLVHMVDKLTGSKSPYIVKPKTESILTKVRISFNWHEFNFK